VVVGKEAPQGPATADGREPSLMATDNGTVVLLLSTKGSAHGRR
jgi:hypothetical protein